MLSAVHRKLLVGVVLADVSLGDALAVTGLAFALLVYGLQTALARRRDLLAARAALMGVRHGMIQGWGKDFFSTVYGEAEADRRAPS